MRYDKKIMIVWYVVLALVFIGSYFKAMGVNAYALICFFGTIVILFLNAIRIHLKGIRLALEQKNQPPY
jgi:hypothetical protein